MKIAVFITTRTSQREFVEEIRAYLEQTALLSKAQEKARMVAENQFARSVQVRKLVGLIS
jgi:hypothetical protein